jgi:hypothetical protein
MKQYRYRVILATHTSSSHKSDPPYYEGSSTSTWHLARATRRANNLVGLVVTGPYTTGGGNINITGVFTAEATSNRQNGHCQLTAPTGSKDYGFVAPGPFSLAFTQDPNARSRLLAVLGLGFPVYATLGNPYFPSECSTDISGEPDNNTTHMTSVSKSVFGRRIVTIRFAGHTTDKGIDYTWSTTIKLKLIPKKHRR